MTVSFRNSRLTSLQVRRCDKAGARRLSEAPAQVLVRIQEVANRTLIETSASDEMRSKALGM